MITLPYLKNIIFSKKHYDRIAILFAPVAATNKRFFVNRFADMFERDNTKFDKEKFINACFKK